MLSVRPHVLVVDDVEANLAAMEALLHKLDCVVVCARSGNDALRILLKRQFAVILLDVQMPEMDGFEVARLARLSPASADVPILFVTALLETEESLIRAYGTGAVDVLFKPVNPHVLLSKVKVFLDLYRSRLRLADEIEAHKRTLAELDAFNYSISHDLRAPLRPLEGFSRILLDDYGDKLDDAGRHALTRISAAATRMGHLIDDLLRLSQISRAQVRLRSVDLSELASAVVAELRQNDAGRDVEFVVPGAIMVEADARLLRIALENLLRNAWKFTSKRSVAKIEFGVSADDGDTVYFLRDNGVGFDAARTHTLFRPFQRLHDGADFDGSGIGLAIVKRIIQHHGGRVWAEAAPDRGGATFFFTLGS
jgi:two-component system sensor histidine kinase/response regulator